MVSGSAELAKRMMEMPLESVVQIEGTVKTRLKKKKDGESSKLVADELEIQVERCILLNPAERSLPFYPNHPELVSLVRKVKRMPPRAYGGWEF